METHALERPEPSADHVVWAGSAPSSPARPTSDAAASTHRTGGGQLRLLSGEQVLETAAQVTHLCPYDGPVSGTLILTNYRLIFQSQLAEDESKTDRGFSGPGCGHGAWGKFDVTETQWKGNGTVVAASVAPGPEVVLGAIDRVAKEGGVRTKKEHAYCLVVYCRDFRYLRFAFLTENHARRPIYGKLLKAAFPVSFQVDPPFFANTYHEAFPGSPNGWVLHDLEREMARQGVPLGPGATGWRITDANSEYQLCTSYSRRWVVPADADDALLRSVAQFRSRGRLPILSWRHPGNGASITRCAQPMVGMWKRSQADELYLSLIAATAKSGADTNTASPRLYIVDARPLANAVANQAKGAGFEPAAAYPNATLEFMDIQNIHVMRESLRKVAALCFPNVEEANWYSGLHLSKWLDHIRLCLAAAKRIVDLVEAGSPCLVHCSDGWDRTSQLTSLSLLMLDGYYRTREGFAVLIEREWLETGHKFALRTGHGDSHHGDDQRSPIFIQFLDAVHQLIHQFPSAFEFNGRFLVALADELYACRFGTFLYNCDRERQSAKEKTTSVWTYMLSTGPVASTFINPRFEPQKRVLRANVSMRALRVWTEYFVRWTPQLAFSEQASLRDWQLQTAAAALEQKLLQVQEELAAVS